MAGIATPALVALAPVPAVAATTQLLVLSQRTWVGWRDAECDFAASPAAGGGIQVVVRAQCLADLTDARISDFCRYLACDEGDPSCPVPPSQ
jgi:uncharacterized protein YecT (DUF1311 family)